MVRSKPRRLSILLGAAAAAVFALAFLWPQMQAQAQRVRVQVFLTQARITQVVTAGKASTTALHGSRSRPRRS
jgi:hypothetical protein